MKSFNLPKQSGAVLAFSLLMLLLLTLAATRMIQQNKQQLEMANNARLLTQEFANAEGLLASIKSDINLMHQHIDPTGTAINNSTHQCVPTDTYKQNIGLAGVLSSSATILSVSCLSVPDSVTFAVTSQICSYYDETTEKTVCNTDTDCQNVTEAIAASTGICYQDYDPQADNPNPPSAIVKGKCPSEVYKIRIVSTSENGTTREIISDHAVGCGT